MNSLNKLVLLLMATVCVRDTACRLDRDQLTRLLLNAYSSDRRLAESRRNIADVSNIPSTRTFQEASSRDLDVGFAVGVKDDDSGSDSVTSSHFSGSAYLPNSVIDQTSPGLVSIDELPSNELNIGLFVDPKNGVSYFSPGYATRTGFIATPITIPSRYDGALSADSIQQPTSLLSPVAYTSLLNPYQHSPFSFGRHAAANPIPKDLYSATDTLPEYNVLPYPYQSNLNSAPATDGYFVFTPLQKYSLNNEESSLTLNNIQQSTYPYQRPYQNIFELPYNRKRFSDLSNNFPDMLYHQPTPTPLNSLYSGTYPDNYRLFPKEPYRPLAHQVAVRQKPQEAQIILDRQGIPVMSEEPYGDHRVGTFRLRHDNGYQVLMQVPPVPTGEPSDGILVMEMKATLYRPL